MKQRLFYYLLSLMMNFTSYAGEFHYLVRSPKALLMGDAYTAIANDAYTLFYNPAALSRHGGLSVYFVNPDVGVTNVLDDLDKFEDFPERDAAAIADRILGTPLHLRLGGTPGLKMESFGMNLFAGVNADVVLRNAIHPNLEINYRLDRGIIAGYAFSMGNGARNIGGKRRKGGGGGAGTKVSFGGAFKTMNRQGIKSNFDLFGLELINKITESDSTDMDEIRKSLGYSYGKGYGFDIGTEFTWKSNISMLNIAFSALDIGNTTFRIEEGSRQITEQKMTLNTGIAWSQDFFILDYTVAIDFHPMTEPIDFMRKIHVGVEIGLPIVSVLFGWNGGYVSYGLTVEFWPISLYAGFYGVEIGSEYGQAEGKRGIVYLSLLDFEFSV
ncbi:hypothetical protein OAB57_02180 [Bacteriovoracaceae bacterium]|nr:hypothetical protein [Bacteriovoracaceae bacterium]